MAASSQPFTFDFKESYDDLCKHPQLRNTLQKKRMVEKWMELQLCDEEDRTRLRMELSEAIEQACAILRPPSFSQINEPEEENDELEKCYNMALMERRFASALRADEIRIKREAIRAAIRNRQPTAKLFEELNQIKKFFVKYHTVMKRSGHTFYEVEEDVLHEVAFSGWLQGFRVSMEDYERKFEPQDEEEIMSILKTIRQQQALFKEAVKRAKDKVDAKRGHLLC